MMSRHFVVLTFVLVTLAPAVRAFAQDRQPVFEPPTIAATMPEAGPLRTAIERIRFDAAGDPAVRIAHSSSSATQAPQPVSILGRVVLASVAGMAGFLGGGMLGARIEGPCNCDDPGLKGALIGAPIGAVVGAVAGWKVAGLLRP